MYNYQILICIELPNIFLEGEDSKKMSSVFTLIKSVLLDKCESVKEVNVRVKKEIICIYDFTAKGKNTEKNKYDIEKEIEWELKEYLNNINFKYKTVMVLMWRDHSKCLLKNTN